MYFSIFDYYWYENHFYCKCYNKAFAPVVNDVWATEELLDSKIDNTNHHSVEAKDKHRADGDESDEAALDAVERLGKVDECIY